MRLFVNGRDAVNLEEGPVAYPGPVTFDTAMALSRDFAEPGALLADVLLYDRVLTPAQVRSLYRTGALPPD